MGSSLMVLEFLGNCVGEDFGGSSFACEVMKKVSLVFFFDLLS